MISLLRTSGQAGRIVVAGASSHCGKTTVACGLLASLRHKGFSVSAFKTGPDYIDPFFLRKAGACEAFNLDSWLMPEEKVRELFVKYSRGVSVIEGAMGLYDGGINSTAGIAKLLDAPVVLVVDAKSTGESAAAAALGFREYDHDVNLAGVILNNIGSDYHEELIADALTEKGIKYLGALRREDGLAVPERHLGLALEGELDAEKLRLAVERGIDVEEIARIAGDVKPVNAEVSTVRPSARGAVVGVARDEAFTFYYPESLAVLEELGAELVYFSPLHDEGLPEADGYIFGGGFPEMFAESLSANSTMLASVRECRRPVLAECGGMMYLCRSLTDLEGRTWPMSGLLPADAAMTKRAVLGYLEAEALSDNILCRKGQKLRGHEFHYSRIEPEGRAFVLTRRNTNTSRFGGFAQGSILASYLHTNFFGKAGLGESFLEALTSSRVQRVILSSK